MSTDTTIDAPIAEVTVFRDGARLLRRGMAALETGTRTVVVAGLPASVDDSSVRVVARGSGASLRDVEVQRGYSPDPLLESTARLRAEVEEHRDRVQALEDEDSAEQARLDFLGHLSEAAATAFARAVGFGRAEHGELARMADELSSGTAAALARRRETAARRRVAKRALDAAKQRLADAESNAGRTVVVVDVRATLEVTKACEAEVEVSYHVNGASWRPLYDLRLEGERLGLDYLSEVTQQTGEDWPAAKLAFSTTRRGRHSQLPELSPWYIGRAMPPQARAAPRAFAASAMSMSADEDAAFEAQAVGAAPGGNVVPAHAPLVAAVEESGAALLYRVQAPLPVPSDGSPYKTTIARLDLDAVLDHLTVPSLAPEAYLRATVTNNSELMLLPGPANVFHDDEYVGASRIDTIAPGEELELQLGVDDRIRVERELRRRSTGKAVLGGTRNVDVAYEVTVESHREQPSKVTVLDHVPVSRDGDVKVKLREATPKPVEQDDLGQLTWELALEQGEKQTVRFAFTVEHPAGVVLFGL